MSWILPSIVASLCSSTVLVLVFAFLFFQYREKHMRTWTWGWLFYALRFAIVLCSLYGLGTSAMQPFAQLSVLVSGLFLLKGTNEFVGHRSSRLWLPGGIVGGLWILCSELTDLPFLLQTLPIFLFYASISVWTGVLFLRSPNAEGPGKYLTGWGLILWGLHKADYPFLRPLEWFAPWGFLLGGVLGLAVAMGMLLVYFQKIRRNLIKSREHYRTVVEAVPHGILECDLEGKITFANETYGRMQDTTPEQLIGKHLWDLTVLPELREEVRRRLAETVAERPTPSTEIVHHLDASGKPVSRQVDWNYLRNARGETSGFIAVITDITQRERMEQALRESEENYRSLVEFSPIPMFVHRKGRFVFLNPAAVALHGAASTEELIGRPLGVFIHPDDRGKASTENTEVVGTAQDVRYQELRIVRLDGEIVDLEVTSMTVNYAGEPARLAICMDATERKAMVNELLKSESRYRGIVEDQTDFIVRWRPDGTLTYVNESICLYTAKSPRELIGTSFFAPMTEANRQSLTASLADLTPEAPVSTTESEDVRNDGSAVWLQWANRALFDSEGQLREIQSVGKDVTARKKAEIELKNQTKLLQTILNTIPAPIFFKDAKGVYLGCNQAFEGYIGLPRQQVVGATVYDVAPKDLADIYHAADLELLRQGGTQAYETQVRYADGSRHDVIFHKAVFKGDDDAPGGMVGAILDITERKAAEEALAASENRYRTLVENIPAVVYQCSPDKAWTMSFLSDRIEEISGYPAADFYQNRVRSYASIIHPDDREGVAEQVDAAVNKGQPFTLEYRIRHADGTWRWIYEKGQAIYRGPGDMSLEGALFDITEHKRHEDLVFNIARGLSAETGETFSRGLVAHLATTLQADYAFIGVLDPEHPGQVATIAAFADGWATENFVYDLKDTPCEQVIGHGVCSYPSGVQEAFPADELLVQMSVHGYVGAPLFNSAGTPLGILVVLFRTPIEDPRMAESLLQIFAARAAAELERCQDQQTLQESEERFRTAFHTSPDAIAIARLEDGCIVDVNAGFVRQTGYAAQEVLGKTSADLRLWTDSTDRNRFLQGLRRQGAVNNMEATFCLKGGSLRTGLLSACIFSLQEKPHFIVVIRDVTEIKAAEVALRDKEKKYKELFQQFQALLNGISDPLIHLSPQLEVLWSNQGANLAGHQGDPEEPLRACNQAWMEQTGACVDCPAQRSIQSGREESAQVSSGNGSTWEIRTFPIKDENGTVTSVIEMREEITAKVKRQKDHARTGQLVALGELAAGVAHEINNPITGVINYAQILANRNAHDTMEHDIANRIIREGDRIAAIVSNLLSFAREKGQEKRLVALHEILADALELTTAQMRKDDIELRIDVPSDLPLVEGSHQQLQQVFLNVLSNARHALNLKYPKRAQGKVLQVTGTSDQVDDRAQVRITFTDHGCGIAEHVKDKVMNPFFTTKPPGEGTGLGLSISHEIITEHGGRMAIDSVEGEYTNVTIALFAAADRGQWRQ